jgi:branched-chain amino acid transport system ATP-binding protein
MTDDAMAPFRRRILFRGQRHSSAQRPASNRNQTRRSASSIQFMLAIARGLMTVPKVLIIDALSLGLAPVVVGQLIGTLKALKASGVTILLVEQNVHLALALSDYAYVTAEGRPFCEGPSDTVATMPEIRQAYLGL